VLRKVVFFFLWHCSVINLLSGYLFYYDICCVIRLTIIYVNRIQCDVELPLMRNVTFYITYRYAKDVSRVEANMLLSSPSYFPYLKISIKRDKVSQNRSVKRNFTHYRWEIHFFSLFLYNTKGGFYEFVQASNRQRIRLSGSRRT